MQLAEPASEDLPMLQIVHADAPAAEYVLTAQSSHVQAPGADEYEPAGHAKQLEAPAAE